MKTIILVLLFSNIAFAGNYFPVGKAGAKTTWSNKAKCEQMEGQACFEISGKDMRRYKIGLIDNLNSPKYSKRSIIACSDESDCETKRLALDCSSYAEGTEKYHMIGDIESYCKEPSGYNQVDGLVVDAAQNTAADAEDAQKASDKSSRSSAKATRDTILQSCIQDSKQASLSGTEIRDCIAAIVRELMGDKVGVADL